MDMILSLPVGKLDTDRMLSIPGQEYRVGQDASLPIGRLG